MNRIISLAAMLALSALAATANAIPLPAANFLGYVDPGTPADATGEVAFINALRGMATGATATSDGAVDTCDSLDALPGNTVYNCSRVSSTLNAAGTAAATATGASNGNAPAGTVDVSAWDWILLKYGQTSYIWYVGNLSGVYDIAANINFGPASGNGLSHISLYNFTNVPEPGMLSLLGAGLVGVALIRRRRALKA